MGVSGSRKKKENNKKIIDVKQNKNSNNKACGKFIGELKNGKKEGKGTAYYNNGDKYEGEFKNDLRDGYWIYFYGNEKYKDDVYIGYWKEGKFEGKGIYYYNRSEFKG